MSRLEIKHGLRLLSKHRYRANQSKQLNGIALIDRIPI